MQQLALLENGTRMGPNPATMNNAWRAAFIQFGLKLLRFAKRY
jgi:hypothetical protein